MSNRNIGLAIIGATLIALLELVITGIPLMFVWYPIFLAFGFAGYIRNVRKSRGKAK